MAPAVHPRMRYVIFDRDETIGLFDGHAPSLNPGIKDLLSALGQEGFCRVLATAGNHEAIAALNADAGLDGMFDHAYGGAQLWHNGGKDLRRLEEYLGPGALASAVMIGNEADIAAVPPIVPIIVVSYDGRTCWDVLQARRMVQYLFSGASPSKRFDLLCNADLSATLGRYAYSLEHGAQKRIIRCRPPLQSLCAPTCGPSS